VLFAPFASVWNEGEGASIYRREEGDNSMDFPHLLPQTASQRINCTNAAWNRLEGVGTSHLAKVGPKGRHPRRAHALGMHVPLAGLESSFAWSSPL
jgi:hypothetical protein